MSNNALPAAAQDYPLLNAFWTMMWVFLWIFWLFLVVRVSLDIFRSKEIGGWGKAGWLAVVVILPFIGVLLYLIVHGGAMDEPDTYYLNGTDDVLRSQPEHSAGSSTSTADELSKLAKLHDSGVLTDEEFASQKAAVLR